MADVAAKKRVWRLTYHPWSERDKGYDVFASPQEDAISNEKEAAGGSISPEKDASDGVLSPELISDINTMAAKLPEAGREQFIRDAKLAAAVALTRSPRSASDYEQTNVTLTLIKCENRYHAAHAAYEMERTLENAKALISAYQNLRSRHKELELPQQPRERLVGLAYSQSRPSQAKAPTQPPGKPRRGRPKLMALA